MALTVRPDDEVYQFDTVWLGPDEYTLPIQARYVAWGTWLACFLIAAAVLVPIGGGGPAGVLGSLIWALALSVVLARAVMLVVDHERPLRSLPALFSAEARAAVAARRRGDRVLLVRPARVRVREVPDKVWAIRERQRARAATRRRREPEPEPVIELEPLGPEWRAEAPYRAEWSPDLGAYDEHPAPGWSLPVPAEARPPVLPVEEALPPNGHAPAGHAANGHVPAGHATADGQAEVEARILLPARKDR